MQEHKMITSFEGKYIFCITCFQSSQATFPEEYFGRNCEEIPYEDYNHFKDRKKGNDCDDEGNCEMCNYIATLDTFDVVKFYEDKYGIDYYKRNDKFSDLNKVNNGK